MFFFNCLFCQEGCEPVWDHQPQGHLGSCHQSTENYYEKIPHPNTLQANMRYKWI